MSGPICPFFLVCFAVGADRFEQSSVHWPGRQKKCTGLWKFVRFTDPAQHRPNALFRSDMAATWALDLGAHLAPTSAQLGSNMAKLGPNLDPFREQLRHKLKSTWLQNGGMADSKRNPQNTPNRLVPAQLKPRTAKFWLRLGQVGPFSSPRLPN